VTVTTLNDMAYTEKVKELSRELKMNLNILTKPRLDLIALAILSLVKMCSISLVQISLGMDTKSKHLSNYRRLQRFIEQVSWDSLELMRLVIKWVQIQGPYTLLIDRTQWQFGSRKINILCISILGQGYSIPIAWSLLDKKGNSSQRERKDLMEKVIASLGSDQIEWIVGDREFGGKHWYKYLIDNGIKYAIRLKDNQIVYRYGKRRSVKRAISNNARKGQHCDGKRYWLGGVQVYLHGFRIRNDKHKLEYLIIASTCKQTDVIELYRNRWYIENMFKDMKSNGLSIEDTHVTNLDRLHTLLGLVVLAHAWIIRIGKWVEKRCRNPLKDHKPKKRRKSVFRMGLDTLKRDILCNNHRKIWIYIRFLSCT
jgi:hypothetical protein